MLAERLSDLPLMNPLCCLWGLGTPTDDFRRDMIQPTTAPVLTPSPWLQTPAQLSVQGPLEWALETQASGTALSLLGLPAFLSSFMGMPYLYALQGPKLSLKQVPADQNRVLGPSDPR